MTDRSSGESGLLSRPSRAVVFSTLGRCVGWFCGYVRLVCPGSVASAAGPALLDLVKDEEFVALHHGTDGIRCRFRSGPADKGLSLTVGQEQREQGTRAPGDLDLEGMGSTRHLRQTHFPASQPPYPGSVEEDVVPPQACVRILFVPEHRDTGRTDLGTVGFRREAGIRWCGGRTRVAHEQAGPPVKATESSVRSPRRKAASPATATALRTGFAWSASTPGRTHAPLRSRTAIPLRQTAPGTGALSILVRCSGVRNRAKTEG